MARWITALLMSVALTGATVVVALPAQAAPPPVLFSPAVPTGAPGVGTTEAAVGDMTGDGVPDIVESFSSDEVVEQVIRVLVNDGSGQFTVGGRVEVSYTETYETPALADFDNDGNLDVAFASSPGNGAVAVLLGDGAGNLGAPEYYHFLGGGLREVSVGDVNGDSNADVVATAYRSGKVQLLLGDGSGALAPPRLVVAGPPQDTPRAAVGDVNGDGLDDIVVIGSVRDEPDLIRTMLATGNNFTSVYSRSDGPVSDARLGDLDGDGDLDMVGFGGNAELLLQTMLGDGEGHFVSADSVPGRSIRTASADNVTMADVNGDGLLDVVALVFKNTPVRVYPGRSRGMLARVVMLPPISTALPTTVSAADLDDDGWTDLVVGARPTDLLFNAAG